MSILLEVFAKLWDAGSMFWASMPGVERYVFLLLVYALAAALFGLLRRPERLVFVRVVPEREPADAA